MATAAKKPAAKAALLQPKPVAKPKPPKAETAVAVRENAAVSTDTTNWRDRMTGIAGRAREQMAKAPASGGNKVSFRGGTMTYQDRDIGHELSVIVLAMQFERSYYEKDFDPDNITSPACYSFDGVTPHPDAADKQSERCKGCNFDAFESARQGKGKGCKEGLKIAFVPASDEMTPASLAVVDIATAGFSVLNTKVVRASLENMFDEHTHPMTHVMTLTCNPDKKRILSNTLEIDYALHDALVESVSARVETAESLLTVPYTTSEAPASAAKSASKGKPRKF